MIDDLLEADRRRRHVFLVSSKGICIVGKAPEVLSKFMLFQNFRQLPYFLSKQMRYFSDEKKTRQIARRLLINVNKNNYVDEIFLA